jgi:hypothetical protein
MRVEKAAAAALEAPALVPLEACIHDIKVCTYMFMC